MWEKIIHTWFKHILRSKDRGIKLTEVCGAEKGVDPDLKPEWIVRKSQKLAEKSGLEHPSREIDASVQEQTQFTKENHVNRVVSV